MRLAVCTLCVFMVSGLSSYAQQGGAPNAGSAAAQAGTQAGTNAYNSNGIVQDTMKNMGSGQSAEDALTNAAKTNAYNGLSKDLPTANSNSAVVQDPIKNTGAGQSAEDALTNAAKSAAAPTR